MINNTLISVCVVTYNSESTIIETLNSIKEQTYPYVEVIISDDCSKDSTIEICQAWITENKMRFYDCKIIKTPYNKGVSGNFNNAINEAKGHWVKIIAGDDILLPNCLQFYMDQVSNHPEEKIFLSRVQSFSVNEYDNKIFNPVPDYNNQIILFNSLNAQDQCKYLLDEGGDMLTAPTLFIEKDLMAHYPYNELYRYMEDYPQFVKLTDCGFKICIFNELTVYYRKANSVSRDKDHYYSSRLLETKNLYFWNEKLFLFKKYNCQKGYDDSKRALLTENLIEGLTKNNKSRFHDIMVVIIKFIVRFVHYNLL